MSTSVLRPAEGAGTVCTLIFTFLDQVGPAGLCLCSSHLGRIKYDASTTYPLKDVEREKTDVEIVEGYVKFNGGVRWIESVAIAFLSSTS